MNLYTFSKLKVGDSIRISQCSDYNCDDREQCIGNEYMIREIFVNLVVHGKRHDYVRFWRNDNYRTDTGGKKKCCAYPEEVEKVEK